MSWSVSGAGRPTVQRMNRSTEVAPGSLLRSAGQAYRHVVDIRVLGPVEIRADGAEVRLGGPKQRTVLAVLAADVGKPVSVDALIEAVWEGEPTPGARSTLQTYVSNLRAELGEVIVREGGGYRLDLEPRLVDSIRFEQAVGRATELVKQRPAEAAQQLRAALALWRGRPYADASGSFRLELEAARLEEVRLGAVESKIEAELALGHHAELVPELEVLCAEFPLREGFRAQHMLALYRSGRQAEALRAFQKTRTYLADELGLEPSAQLRELERRILNQDDSLLPAVEPQVETVAFLLTDIQDSTPLWELETDAMRVAIAKHDEVVYGAVEAAGGRVVKRVGDGIDAAFADVGAAVTAARSIQLTLAEQQWPTSEPMRVRMGIDVGEVEARRGDYFGPVLNRAGRLMASAHGGQVLLTGEAHAALAASEAGWQARALGEFRYKGIGAPVTVFQLVLDGLPAEFPPLRIDRLPATPDPSAFDRTVRGYELREQVGSGEVGVVYRAYQPSIGREVAVKVIPPELANQAAFIRRFEADAQLVAQLEHPHIVSLYDFWRDPEGAYLVMRWLRGGSLRQALSRGGWKLEPALRLLSQVGGALAYAHRNGVVHGDVEPASVLFDAEGHAYLSDFDVAGRGGTAHDDVRAFVRLTAELLGDVLPAELEGALTKASESGLLDTFLAALVAAAASPAPETLTPAENPYKGLRAFGAADAETFHGRDALVGDLLAAVAEHRLVAVVGPSGIGKSSVVKAGLIPALRAGGLPGSDRWAVTDMFPGSYPFEELAAALVRVAVEEPPGLVDELARDELGLRRVTKRILPPDTELLLVVDQFEELFTLTAGEEARRTFLDALTALAEDSRSAVRVVVTLRADFLDHPLRYPEFGELLRAGLVAVTAPSQDELAEAIEQPAAGAGVRFEPGLVSQIIRDVHDQPGALPLLQYALTELFAARTSDVLTIGGYEAVGGVVGALGRRAEQLYGELEPAGQAAARQVFLRLVSVDPEAQDTRRRVRRRELRRLELDPGAVDEVLGLYGEHRLLTFDREPLTRSPTVEVAHEAILGQWERLRGWIDERREDLLLHRRLAEGLEEWEQAGRNADYLPREGRLAQFQTWAATTDVALTALERDFLAEARAAADDAARRRARRRRALLAGFATLAAAASVAAVLALVQRGEARDEARLSKARSLAAAAQANLDIDPERSVLLAIEAVETTKRHDGTVLQEAEQALHDALAASRTVRRYEQADVDGDLAPDGGRLAVVDPERTTASVRDRDTGEIILKLSGHAAPIRVLDWSPDGRLIATASEDGTARLWDASSGAAVRTISRHGGGLFSVRFGHDGAQLVTLGFDGAAYVWDTASGARVARFRGVHHREPQNDPWKNDMAALGSGGVLVVANQYTGGRPPPPTDTVSARVFDVASGRVRLLEGPGGPGSEVALSPDGTLLVTGSATERLNLWRLPEGELIDSVDRAPADDIEFSADGRRIAVTWVGGDVRIFGVSENGLDEQLVLNGHGGPVRDVNFSADGQALLSVGAAIARLWDVTAPGPGELLAAPGPEGELIGGAEFTPDGERLVASSGPPGLVRVFDARTGEVARELGHHAAGGFVVTLDVSPDGKRVATASFDGTAAVLDLANGRPTATMRGHECSPPPVQCWVLGVAFSPDGSRIATTGSDATTRVWDARTGRELHTLRGHEDQTFPVEWSPDGRRLLSGSRDGTTRIWDAETGRLVRVLKNDPEGPGWTAAWSHDGSRVLVEGHLGGPLVLNPATGRNEGRLATGEPTVRIAFSPGGRRVAVGAIGGSVRIFDWATREELLSLPVPGISDFDFSPDGKRLVALGSRLPFRSRRSSRSTTTSCSRRRGSG